MEKALHHERLAISNGTFKLEALSSDSLKWWSAHALFGQMSCFLDTFGA